MTGKIYFISGGGTGGHIYPAFTIVEKLIKDNNNKIFYIGNPKNLEFEISKKYPSVIFLGVDISGMPRKLSLSIFGWGIKFIFALFKAIYYIKKYKPDGIFTTGGYVSAPIVFASQFLNHPYMIHDCDSVPGIVSRFAAPKAKIVSVAFESSKKVLKSNNIICNGNPVRDAFFTVTKKEARENLNISLDKKVIFAMGGSQGAKTINNAMIGILETLCSDNSNFVILQTGKKNYDEVIEKLEEIYPKYKENKNLLIKSYFEETVYPLKSADLIISRAGSLSLTEILNCHVPAILIPYPYAAQDHQRKNAKEMCDKGIAFYLEDSDCSSKSLLNIISNINNEQLIKMKDKAKALSQSNPSDLIVEQLNSTIKTRY